MGKDVFEHRRKKVRPGQLNRSFRCEVCDSYENSRAVVALAMDMGDCGKLEKKVVMCAECAADFAPFFLSRNRDYYAGRSILDFVRSEIEKNENSF